MHGKSFARITKIYSLSMKPREFFPNMPNEVFDTWLNPIIEEKGWPYSSLNDDLQATEWKYILGINTSLMSWFKCRWVFMELIAESLKLDKSNLAMIEAIVRHSAFGETTMAANIMDTQERFRACTAFFTEQGLIPRPVVLKRIDSGFYILDGHHRLAAVAHVGLSNNLLIPSWVTEH